MTSPRTCLGTERVVSQRLLASLLLALMTLVAASVAVVGPARHESTRISWPAGDEIEGPAPRGTAFVLAERTATYLDARIPLAGLQGDRARQVLLATSRHPSTTGALLVEVVAGRLVVRVGDEEIAGGAVPPGVAPDLTLRWSEGTLELSGPIGPLRRDDPGGIVVTGLFSDLPLVGRDAPRVVLDAASDDTGPSALQVAAVVLAVALGAAAVALLPRGDGGRRARGRRWAKPDLLDGAVIATLMAWWLVAPVFSDDGWFLATALNRRASGTSSFYSDYLGSMKPLGFPHDLLLAALSTLSRNLLWLRLPALMAGIASWAVVRRVSRSRTRSVAVASVFLVGWVASDMTLRPEPIIALIVTIVAARVLTMNDEAAPSELLGPALLAAIALAIHPIGITVVAPVLVMSRTIVRAIRAHGRVGLASAVAIVMLAVSLFGILAVADSDLATWRAAQDQVSSQYIERSGISQEPYRYELLFETNWGPPIRRLAYLGPGLVAFAAVAAWSVRPRSRPPRWAGCFLIGLALLTLSPSKWPNHVGVLAGIGALTMVDGRFLLSGRRRRVAVAAGILASGGLAVGTLVVNRPIDVWGPFSPVSEWAQEAVVPVAAVLLGILVLWWLVREWRDRERERRVGALFVSAVALPAVAVLVATLGVFAVDGVGSRSWSPLRQALGVESGGCGIVGSAWVLDPASAVELRGLGNDTRREPRPVGTGAMVPGWSVPVGATFRSGWFDLLGLGTTDQLVLWVSGPSGVAPNVALEFVAGTRHAVRDLGLGAVTSAARPLRIAPPRWASRVRVTVDPRGGPGTVWVSSPRRARAEQLRRLAGSDGLVTLPTVEIASLIPCASIPTVRRGVAQVPDLLIGDRRGGRGLPALGVNDPFLMLHDVVVVRPLIVWGRGPSADLRVERVDRRRLSAFEDAPSG